MADEGIRIGISSCLLGEKVRYDGGHKKDNYITGTLADYFEFVPVCPEAAIGLGIPRPTIRLVGAAEAPRVRGVKDASLDVTDRMVAYGREMVGRLTGLRGYIFKRGSPSCGMERVKVYTEQGMPNTSSAGVYAREIMAANPLLPCEEEGRLGDPMLRENFIQRVFVYDRWLRLVDEGLTAGRLVDFHTRHKYMIRAHDESAYREMGRLVAEAGSRDPAELAGAYVTLLMTTLTKRATRKKHANVLMHLMGYLKKHLDAADKAELIETIDEYRAGRLPLIVPIVLLRHHFRRHPNEYVADQYYLDPHPRELMLRNVL
ncbi:MAG: DUF523 and DUF1722 domain-containing protein [Chromatiales bacterium]|nr:DUF523 and DUF1722 domain-containing protein [Gammaproteobacteria bacterium]MCP5353094.1 DUF523 and DUF1722 domain-containing protein [Chromatiales bacterium]